MERGTQLGWIVAGVVVVGIASAVRAGGQEPADPGARTLASSPTTMSGAITSVNLRARSVQVTSPDGSIVTLALDPGATISQNGQAIPLDQLRVGQTVTIRQTQHNGKNVASAIEVKPASAAQPSGSPAAASTPGGSSMSPAAPGAASPSALPASPAAGPSGALTLPSSPSSSSPASRMPGSTMSQPSSSAPSSSPGSSVAPSGSPSSAPSSSGTQAQ